MTQTVSREQWLEARRALLDEEKAFTRQRDALARKRQALPRVRVEKSYTLRDSDGEVDLPGLFGDRSQLLVDHFMFGPDWEEGCPSCSFWADGFSGQHAHLAARDISFVVVSRAPVEKLEAYKARMGWTFRWVSSLGSDFNSDFGVTFSPEQIESGEKVYNFGNNAFPSDEAPGLSAFVREGSEVFHTYSTFARGLDVYNVAYHLMDMMPKGRDEDQLPWPMAWLRRKDQYGS